MAARTRGEKIITQLLRNNDATLDACVDVLAAHPDVTGFSVLSIVVDAKGAGARLRACCRLTFVRVQR